MAPNRRSAERRRRVLYQTHVASYPAPTPADRRAAEQLRAARQPAGAFGSRVNRHLRGRWFSLVPVSGLAIGSFAGVVLAVPLLLTVMHHLAITWPPLAYRQELARPLRLDRPDSFGAYWLLITLVLSGGVTYLIYGLRLHRRDDYRGHYQLWRLTTGVLLLASVHQAVGLVSWLGALLELGLGDRRVLSGANWLRIVLDVGGIIFAMRLTAELYRCRRALATMLAALALLGWSELVAWRMIRIDSPLQFTIYTASPLIAASGTLLATTLYLRALFRQVRGIRDAPPLKHRIQGWIDRWRSCDEDDDDWELRLVQATEDIVAPPAAATRSRPGRQQITDQADDEPDDTDAEEDASADFGGDPKRSSETERSRSGWLGRFGRGKRVTNDGTPGEAVADKRLSETASRRGNELEDAANEDPNHGDKPKRGRSAWRRFLAYKRTPHQSAAGGAGDPAGSVRDASADAKPRKKSWFSLWLRPHRNAAQDAPTGESGTTWQVADQAEDTDSQPKPGLLARLWKRKPAAAKHGKDRTESGEDGGDAASLTAGSRPRGPLSRSNRSPQPPPATADDVADDDLPHPDDIDWDSMNKAERRRMRKRLKRAGVAA